ncbi:unnamed protein product [Urochloa humidicola]
MSSSSGRAAAVAHVEDEQDAVVAAQRLAGCECENGPTIPGPGESVHLIVARYGLLRLSGDESNGGWLLGGLLSRHDSLGSLPANAVSFLPQRGRPKEITE